MIGRFIGITVGSSTKPVLVLFSRFHGGWVEADARQVYKTALQSEGDCKAAVYHGRLSSSGSVCGFGISSEMLSIV